MRSNDAFIRKVCYTSLDRMTEKTPLVDGGHSIALLVDGPARRTRVQVQAS